MDNRTFYFKRFLHTAQQLTDLAEALEMCGNSNLADKLGDIAAELRFDARQFEGELRAATYAEYQETLGNIGKTLNVLLNLEDSDGTVQSKA